MAERQLKNRLKQLRARRGLTQSELAALAGVSRKTVNTVENLIFVPSTALALVLAEALGTRVEDIFYLESEREE